MDRHTRPRLTKRRLQVLLWRFRFLVLAVCVTLAAGIVIDAVRPEEREATQVIALTSDVPAGTVLATDDVMTADLTGQLPGDVFFVSDDVVGRRTVIDLSAGSLLSETMLVPSESQFALGGRHAIPVPLANSELAHLYPPGTRVRVVISPDAHGVEPGRSPGDTVVIDDAVVLTPAHQDQPDAGEGGLLGSSSGGSGTLGSNYLLLGVSPADAILISSIGSTSPLNVIIVE